MDTLCSSPSVFSKTKQDNHGKKTTFKEENAVI